MFGKTRKSLEIIPEDRVSLKPIFGIRPGMYLAALYALALALGLFALLVIPGIAKPGSRVRFTSEPSGAAVRVDGVYAGTAPCEIFVSQGSHRITMVLPGFDGYDAELDSGNRLFASLLFPKRAAIHGALAAADPVRVLAAGGADFARWSFAGEPTATYQTPRTISEAAYRIGPAAADPETALRLEELLRASARFAADRASARELLRAQFLVASGGSSPSPLTALSSLEEILAYLSAVPGSAAWIASLCDEETARTIAASTWYQRQRNEAAALMERAEETASPAVRSVGSADRTVETLSFKPVPAGPVLLARTFPRMRALEAFYIAGGEVDRGLWNRFVSDNAEWAPERKDELIAAGLADEGYMAASDNPDFPAPSVSGISLLAAAAFCEWMTGLLPPALAGYEIRLPTEAEWERAAGFYPQMLGGLWEWCGDPFAPLDFLPAAGWAIRELGSSEFPVKGGSWAQRGASVDPMVRASLPPTSCSDFVGFRPVLAVKAEPADSGRGDSWAKE